MRAWCDVAPCPEMKRSFGPSYENKMERIFPGRAVLSYCYVTCTPLSKNARSICVVRFFFLTKLLVFGSAVCRFPSLAVWASINRGPYPCLKQSVAGYVLLN